MKTLRGLCLTAALILPACGGTSPAPTGAPSGTGRIYSSTDLFPSTVPVLVRPGGTYLAGNRGGDWTIIALKDDGSVDWAKRLGGSEYDLLCGAAVTQDGGIVAVGSYGLSSTTEDAWVVRLNPDGSVRWQERFDILGHAQGIHATSDGGIVIGAYWSGFWPWIFKLDADGGFVWQKTYVGGDLWSFQAAAGDGSFATLASIAPGTLSVFKIDGDGTPVWGKTLDDGHYDYASMITATSDGGCILTGLGSVGPNSGTIDYDLLTVKIAADGSFRWMTKVGGPAYEEANGAAELPNGDVLVCGATTSTQHAVLLRLKADGSVLSQQVCSTPGYHGFKSVRLRPAGGAWLTGNTTSYGGPDPLTNPTSIWFLQTADDYTLPVPLAAGTFTVTSPTVTVSDNLPFANDTTQTAIPTSVIPSNQTVTMGAGQ